MPGAFGDVSPVIVIYGSDGVTPLSVVDNMVPPAGTQGIIIMGTDGGTIRRVKVLPDGSIAVSAAVPGTVDVSDRAARILGHVEVDSSALPAGAATEVTVASILAQLDVALSTRASQATVVAILAQLDVALSTRASATTQTDGTQKAIARGGAKGATVAADVTSTAEGADHQGLDVQIYHGGVAKDPTAIRALTAADVVTAAQGTAAAVGGAWPITVTDGVDTAAVKAADPAEADNGLVTRNLPARTATSARTTVSVDTTVDTLLASNTARRGATVYNDDSKVLYVALGSAATTSDFTIKIAADGYYEIPFNYTGIITAIRASGSGNVRVTELTA